MNDNRTELVAGILAYLNQNHNQQQASQPTAAMSAEDQRVQALLNGSHMQWSKEDRDLVRKHVAEAVRVL